MKNYLGLIFLLFAFTATAQNNRSALLPMPNHIEQVQGKPFSLTGKNITIHPGQPELKFAATTLQSILKDRMQVDIPLSGSRQSPIRLIIDPQLEGKEHYQLKVDQKGMTISGASRFLWCNDCRSSSLGRCMRQQSERNDSYQYR